MEDYIVKYDTGKQRIKTLAWIFCASLVLALPSLMIGNEWLIVITVLSCVFCAVFIMTLLGSYREILLYERYMQVTSFFGGLMTEVQYDDIMHMGFLTEHISSGRGYVNTNLAGDKLDSLIMLLYSGGREEFDGSDFDHLHEVYAFIKQRVNI